VLFLLAILLAGTLPLGAQQLNPGARIRVSRPCSTGEFCALLDGRLVSWHGSTLTLSDGDRGDREVEVLPGSTVEVFRGSHGHALTGLLIGTVTGGVVGALAASSCDDGWDESLGAALVSSWCTGAVVAGGILLGALGGVLVGAVIRTERWDAVVPPSSSLSLGMLPNGRGVGLRWQF
jgi:hypothetical protein